MSDPLAIQASQIRCADAFDRIAQELLRVRRDTSETQALRLNMLRSVEQAGALLCEAKERGCFPVEWKDKRGAPVWRHATSAFEDTDMPLDQMRRSIWHFCLSSWLTLDYPGRIKPDCGKYDWASKEVRDGQIVSRHASYTESDHRNELKARIEDHAQACVLLAELLREQATAGGLAEGNGVLTVLDDSMPAKLRGERPSRVKARAVYDWAIGAIPNAEHMTINEIYDHARRELGRLRDRASGEKAEQYEELLGGLPRNGETFGRYLRDTGLKRYNTGTASTTGGSVRSADST